MILIKGMEMPKNCLECVFYRRTDPVYDYCCISSTTPKGYVPNDCPLVPVPPHGRLIDADAINHEDEIWKKKCIPPQVVYNAWVVAGEMPTVIPADKDGGK